MEQRKKMQMRLFVFIATFSILANVSQSNIRHQKRHTHHKFPDDSVTVGLHSSTEEQGPWEEWSDSNECSRTCGGGVTYQTRTCTVSGNNESTSCTGPSKRYISCNIQDCPDGSQDFRELQCAQFDSIPFGGKYFNWVPYKKGFNECELNCMPKGGDKFYYRHSQAVTDGTKCREDALDVCVQGICMAVGCDMMLGSEVKEDKCRECGGDGSNCKTIEGTFDQTNLQVGYNDIILIPSGATTIRIKEIQPTNNYLAIRNSSGHYYLNGNWQIEFPRKLKFAGTSFQYERIPKGYVGLEYIHASGPTTEPIFIALLFQQKNLGISYEYSVPLGISNTQPDSYTWIYSQYDSCSRTCGGGTQTRTVNCATAISYEVVADYLCDFISKPPTNKTCNEIPCPAHWQVSEWDECSKSCDGGVQYRQVHCQRNGHGATALVAPDDECLANDGPKPVYARACNDNLCPVWKAGEWTQCNQMCGEGEQNRDVKCVMIFGDGQEKVIDASFCNASSTPSSTQSCILRPCAGTEWIVSEWSGCDGICGLSMESREIFCASEDGNLHPESMCSGKSMPPLKKVCSSHSHCEAMWHASEWSECSAKCGKGIKTRTVFCGSWRDNQIHKVSDDQCSSGKEMESVEKCIAHQCAGVWFTGPWTRCSVPCGGGQQTRKVMCLLEGLVVAHEHCDAGTQPFDSEPCNMHPCDEDEIMMVGGCHKSKYGCCQDGITPAGPDYEGCSFDGSEQNCLDTEFGCCVDGKTPASGPFQKGCPKLVHCNETKYGCCPDGVTASKSLDLLGCYEDCENSLWGCCPDGYTPAIGKNNEGCESVDQDCRKSKYGCCPDGFTTATGRDYEGCDFDVSSGEDCPYSVHGCCPDGITPAQGPDMLGCPDAHKAGCEKSAHGCCSDGVTPAKGPKLMGCDEFEGSGDFDTDCRFSRHGCCPDGTTAAEGPHHAGCSKHDETTPPIEVTEIFLCSNGPYGCCKDGITSATGPNHEGCHDIDDSTQLCANTVFGCCPDGTTSALGPHHYGCCSSTEFGCCPDNTTVASGPYHGGCPCQTFPHGCCPDGITVAKGPRYEGCSCEHSAYGCCQDNFSYATGPNYAGCDCQIMLYGCCPDQVTPARGKNGEGCECKYLHFGCCLDDRTPALGYNYAGCPCSTFPFGCCPDGKTMAKGPSIEDCPCEATTHGCCPDHRTMAKGPYNEGCPCEAMLHGCCPDNRTAASGPSFLGCPCMTMPHGCCPDKQMAASGPNFLGCPCKAMAHGCCPDGESVAQGPKYEGCPCTTFPYGCCPDGIAPARDQNFGGCKDVKKVQKNLVTADVCNLPKERGPCNNFSVKWYFDVKYGGCSRFWYGGCDGNGNQFNSQEECENACVNPEGPDACMLPKVAGPCKGAYLSWYYDAATDSCKSFNYSGCLGNNNRYSSKQICENMCVQQSDIDTCDQPLDVGPCKKVTQRWFFDKSERTCKPFIFGGCKGNNNNFDNEIECIQRCVLTRPSDFKTMYNATIGSHVTMVCKAVPTMEGDRIALVLWFKGDSAHPIQGIDMRLGPEKKTLVETRDSGSRYDLQDGPHMTALTIYKVRKEDEGQYRCRVDFMKAPTINRIMNLVVVEPSICHLPQAMGNCYHFRERWYYNSHERRCQRFYYSGCGGNENNFGSYLECEKQCERLEGSSEEEFKLEYCLAEPDAGPCNRKKIQWFYDKDGVCKQFYYGGCKGNGNRFNTKKDCEVKCVASQDICKLPKIRGPCSGSFMQWYFEKDSGECQEFSYSGCQGNANRFNDKETCEIQCKKWPSTDNNLPQDPCSQPKDPGPCLGYFLMWYHDTIDNACRSFVYGGCHGNSNRFPSLQECETECRANSAVNIRRAKQAHTPTAAASFSTNEDICRLPPDEGHCSDSQSRWYYDAFKTMCLPFTYKGCGGNKNRFKNSDLCMRFCAGVQMSGVVRDAAVGEIVLPEPEDTCATSNCGHLQCPHGMEEIVDVRGCISCLCSNPCENHSCPDGSQCVVEKYRKPDGEFRSQPLCRLKVKNGECPSTNSSEHLVNGTCHNRCHSDADCPGGLKCCFVACAHVCILPEFRDDESKASENDIEDTGAPSPPQIIMARKDVAVKKGTPALLRCIVKGFPSPKVTWTRNNNPLNEDKGNYKISVDGSLHIMSVEQSDEGMYSCTAENGIGKSVTRFFNLIVFEETSVSVTLVTEKYQVGSPLQMDCVASGTPPLHVSWHLGKDGPELESDEQREIFANHTLYIASAQYNDSGAYVCEAQNQHGKASASLDIRVHDIPIPPSCKDSQFFTSCAMIVKQNYCINPTYAKYCCLSCAIAGQLHTLDGTSS